MCLNSTRTFRFDLIELFCNRIHVLDDAFRNGIQSECFCPTFDCRHCPSVSFLLVHAIGPCKTSPCRNLQVLLSVRQASADHVGTHFGRRCSGDRFDWNRIEPQLLYHVFEVSTFVLELRFYVLDAF